MKIFSRLVAAVAAMAALAVCAPLVAHGGGDPAQPRIAYRLTYDPAALDPVWRVEIDGFGLEGAKNLVLELSNWGDWVALDTYYLRALRSHPPLARAEDRTDFRVEAPPKWDGRLRVSYELAIAPLESGARERFDGLPYRGREYSYGVSANTLAALSWDDMPAAVARTIDIAAPRDWTIVTGFGPPATGRLKLDIPDGVGNTAISFGRPKGLARDQRGSPPISVVQWGGAEDITAPLLTFARTFLNACSETTGAPPVDPWLLIVTEPGHGGCRLDGAIAIGCPAGFDRDADAYTLHFLGHEMFHDWLGGRLKPAGGGEQLSWFWEGFTEYLSLWHLARAGLVSREWFAERLNDYDEAMSRNPHWGKVSFADKAVQWRDPEVEPIAYQGSALTAFSLDAALRRAVKRGLVAVIPDLLAENDGRYSLDSIRAWVEGQGLADFWAARFVAPAASTLRDDLGAIGFAEHLEPEQLPYLGVRLDAEGPFGTVVAVDPDGPGAGLVAVGDRVTGLTPTRSPVPVPADAAPDYPFGLGLYDPAAERVRLDVERGPQHLEIWVRPGRVPGAPRAVRVPGEGLDAFFE